MINTQHRVSQLVLSVLVSVNMTSASAEMTLGTLAFSRRFLALSFSLAPLPFEVQLI